MFIFSPFLSCFPNYIQGINYQNNPMACIGGVGNQYNKIEHGKPENCVWVDPRITGKRFYEILSTEEGYRRL